MKASWPDPGCNDAYNKSPANTTTFWGLTPYFNLVGEIAGDARDAGLNIEEFEIEAELNLWQNTVTARLIYDNQTFTPVLSRVQDILFANGFNRGAATYSTLAANTVAGFDCESLYGDPATIVLASELLAAPGGALFGSSPGAQNTNGLTCRGNSSTDTMISIPAPPQPTPGLTDTHVYPCALVLQEQDYVCDTSAPATSNAATIYTDIYLFHYYRGLLGGNFAMIGETSSNSPLGFGCDGRTPSLAVENANGFLQSQLHSLYGSETVLRPWDWASSLVLLCHKLFQPLLVSTTVS